MKIIRKRIADMERATYNPRVELQPGDAEYETLKRSLEQFGMVEPVVWNERTNRVVGGHLRSARISVTGEIMVQCLEGSVTRAFNPDIHIYEMQL